MARDLLSGIEALRKRPEAVRKRYAIVIALCITLLITIMWAVSLPARFSQESEVVQNQAAGEQSMGESISSLFNQLGASLDAVKDRWGEVSATSTEDGNSAFDLDFEAMLASSTVDRMEYQATSSGTTTAPTAAATSSSTTTQDSL